jgi:hypothetical protein
MRVMVATLTEYFAASSARGQPAARSRRMSSAWSSVSAA